MRFVFSTLIISTALLFTSLHAQAARWHVDSSRVTGPYDGISWATAFNKFEDALNIAVSGDTIWVAKGTYFPPTATSFSMKENVKILGGFAGNETVYTTRDWLINLTRLTSNGNRIISNRANLLLTNAASIDGFVLFGATKDSGAAILNIVSSPTIINCTFLGNTANGTIGGGGGAIFNLNAAPVITNCTFTNNRTASFTSSKGGCIYNVSSAAIITGCTFTANSAGTTGYGGAAFYNRLSPVTIANCTFTSNTSNNNGGAIANDSSVATISGCTFTNNTNTGAGAGIYNVLSSNAIISNCTFTNNKSDFGGGGAIMNSARSAPIITGCTFTGNACWATSGTGSSGGGGAIYNHQYCSPVITNCNFYSNFISNNQADFGGAINNNVYCSPVITNCVFAGNKSPDGWGGAMSNANFSSPVVTNCLFTGNYSQYWGSASVNDINCLPVFLNCTFAGNRNLIPGSGVLHTQNTSILTLKNCIVYGNSDGINSLLNSTIDITYSNVEGGYTGTGNLNVNPLFIAPLPYSTAPSTGGNYHLPLSSPVIDKGSNAAVATTNTADLDGFARIQNSIVDMGVYEYGNAAPCGPSVSISVNPVGAVCTGTSLTFTATPTNGGTSPSYQWQVNGVNAGTNAATFTTNTLVNGDAVKVILTSNACATPTTVTSNIITMVVTAPLTPSVNISANPAGTICTGTSVTFTAAPTNGGASPSFQWQVNGTNAGTGSATFTTSTLSNGDAVKVSMTSNAGCVSSTTATSNTITMNVTTSLVPSVNTSVSPVGSVCTGASVTFTAVPTNGGTLPSYQWQVNGVNTGTNAATFTSNTLSNGDVVKVVMTSNSTCVSPTAATSNSITMSITSPVTPSVNISANPAGTVCTATPVTFTAVPANGGISPSYQWKVNGINAGSNASTFSSSALANGDIVSVTLTPNTGCLTQPVAISNNITMAVNATIAPSINITASANGFCPAASTPVTFTAVAANTGATVAYQWQLNGTNVGTNNAIYVNNNIADGDRINCIMNTVTTCSTNPDIPSNTIIMVLKPVPVISFNPASATIASGSTVQLHAIITGNYASYAWTPAAGLNSSATLDPVAGPSISTLYKLKVTTVDNCEVEKTLPVTIYNDIHIPNSFTPDGNGKNDIFRIPPGTTLSLQYFLIYNRYGEIVFKTTDINSGWDGTFKGARLPAGTYTYMIKGSDQKGTVNIAGTVIIIR
jgi:gliding motility-associated-like protein